MLAVMVGQEKMDIVLLEWSFTPTDYFEDEIRVKREDYEMIIKDGKVEARVNPAIYDREGRLQNEVQH